ncbi:putative antirepressor protein [Histophilus somni 2336]|uniref:phage antirepressor N-terminal domain-containing protein n=1 Tax=Histophilus somni TaxID=731 RepID=UPI00003976AE|nr:phage antirepressor N-terminal domain-containing protein [Histophilus somni]ACA32543.1 putative antirepressor protein [Histophilus somni 2336]
MTTQVSTQTISFNNQALVTFEQNGTHYTAMKPICENIGLDWASQYSRIKRDDILNSTIVIITTVAEDSKIREMLCLPIDYLNGWLFGIDVNRCKPEIRETLIKYKKECYAALHDYWFKGKAERKTTVDDRTGLRNAVNMLVSKKGLLYNEAYNLVHHYMNVESIEDIPADKLQSAVEYVHKICLESELIITPPKTADRDEITISAELFEAIMKHTRLAKKLAEQTEIFHRQLFLMLGLERHIRNDIGALSYDVAHEFNPWLQKGEEILATHNPLALPRF